MSGHIELLTIDEVCVILRCSNMTVYREIKRKKLPAIRVGKMHRIRRDDLERYMRGGFDK